MIDLTPAATGRRAFVIVGTAPSIVRTPWTDPTLLIACLNDAYMLHYKDGSPIVKRADAWYDLHPYDHFLYRDPARKEPIYAHEIPPDHFVRPFEHLKWLREQQIPILYNQEWLTGKTDEKIATVMAKGGTDAPPTTWPLAMPFPRLDIEARFGTYFASTPAWMLCHALLLGYKEIHVYGIHLATEQEYIEQRPNFEAWLYFCLAHGIKIILPPETPILKPTHRYAFEPKPGGDLAVLQHKLQGLAKEREDVVQTWKTYAGWKNPKGLQDQLKEVEARAIDVQQQLQRALVKRRGLVGSSSGGAKTKTLAEVEATPIGAAAVA